MLDGLRYAIYREDARLKLVEAVCVAADYFDDQDIEIIVQIAIDEMYSGVRRPRPNRQALRF